MCVRTQARNCTGSGYGLFVAPCMPVNLERQASLQPQPEFAHVSTPAGSSSSGTNTTMASTKDGPAPSLHAESSRIPHALQKVLDWIGRT